MAQTSNHGRFIWHELLTSDPAAAERFYTNVVGWTAKKADGPMDYTLFCDGDVPSAGLMQTPPDAAAMGAPPSWLAYVEVDDVDATLAKAQQLGATILGDAVRIPDVGYFAVLRDPQGAVIGVMTSERQPAPETDPKPLEFSWHELVTTDSKAAVEFYGNLFGWEHKGEFDMGPMGTYYMYGRDRFTYGGMFNKSPDAPQPTMWLYYAYVRDSADAGAERAKAAGGKVVNGPMEVPGGDRIAVIIDPQGAGFAVHSKATVATDATLQAPNAGTPTR